MFGIVAKQVTLLSVFVLIPNPIKILKNYKRILNMCLEELFELSRRRRQELRSHRGYFISTRRLEKSGIVQNNNPSALNSLLLVHY